MKQEVTWLLIVGMVIPVILFFVDLYTWHKKKLNGEYYAPGHYDDDE